MLLTREPQGLRRSNDCENLVPVDAKNKNVVAATPSPGLSPLARHRDACSSRAMGMAFKVGVLCIKY